MQRLFNVERWSLIKEGEAINFGNTVPRRVRIDVNAPEPVKLYYNDPDGNLLFLARVHGRDILDFGCYGEFALTAEGGDCWVYTVDGEDFSFVIPDAVVLTKIVERRARNPELELMQHMMNRNMEMRMEQQRAELERRYEQLAARAAIGAGKPADAGAPAGSGSQQEPAGDSGGAGDGGKAGGGTGKQPAKE